MIEVRLFGALPAVARNGRSRFSVSHRAGITVSAVLAEEGLSPQGIGVVFVNGRHASLDAVLRDGDRLSVFTPAGGG